MRWPSDMDDFAIISQVLAAEELEVVVGAEATLATSIVDQARERAKVQTHGRIAIQIIAHITPLRLPLFLVSGEAHELGEAPKLGATQEACSLCRQENEDRMDVRVPLQCVSRLREIHPRLLRAALRCYSTHVLSPRLAEEVPLRWTVRAWGRDGGPLASLG